MILRKNSRCLSRSSSTKRKQKAFCRPLIECLEDRLVPSNTPPSDGWLLVANAVPNPPDEQHPVQGIIGIVNSGTQQGDQNVVCQIETSSGGNRVYPADVTEAPDGTLYVADLGDNTGTDGHGGGIIKIPLQSGGSYSSYSWINTAHQYNGLVYINNYIYATDYGDGAGSFHSLYQISPSNGGATLINSGGSSSGDGSTGFYIPTGIYPVPRNTGAVYIVDEQQRDTDQSLTNAHGTIWKVTLASGGQSTAAAIVRGSPDLDISQSDLTLGNPEDMAINSSGVMDIVQAGDFMNPSATSGSVVTWTSSGGQVKIPTLQIDAGNGLEIGQGPYGSQTVFIDNYQFEPQPNYYANVIAINADPNNPQEEDFTTRDANDILEFTNGMIIWHPSGGGKGDTPIGVSGGSSSTNLLASQQTQASNKRAVVGNPSAVGQTVAAPSGNSVLVPQTPSQMSSEGNRGSLANSEFLAMWEPPTGQNETYSAYSGLRPAITQAEWQSVLEWLIPA
jgi:hypothetical protein